MRKLLSLACLSVLVLFGMGCGSDDGTPSASARLRVVHASPDAPNVNILVDNASVLQNVAYKVSSNYLTVAAGNRNIKVNAATSGATVINANANLLVGTDTTVLAVGRVAAIEPLILTDNNTAPTAGSVKVRLVHAAPNVGNVDIYVTAPTADITTLAPTLTNIPFKGVSGYLQVPTGDYRVRITPTGQKTVAIDSGTLNLPAGAIRTGVAVGDPGVGQALQAIVLTDN